MSDIQEIQPEQQEYSFPIQWKTMIEDSVAAAHAEMKVTLDGIRSSEYIKASVSEITVKDGVAQCVISDPWFRNEISEFKPGTLISIKSEEKSEFVRKRNRRPRFIRGSVLTIKEQDGAFILDMEIQDPLADETIEEIVEGYKELSIHPRVHKARNRLEAKLHNFEQLNSDDLPIPAQKFLSGDFEQEATDRKLLQSPHLSGSQNVAYGMAMDSENFPVLFIDGGPGTGKTTVIREIIDAHIQEEKSVLVLSHSNRGKDVPAIKLLEKWESEEDQIKDARIKAKKKIHIAGNDPSVIDPRLHKMRIRHNMQFPVREFLKLAQWSDERIIEKYELWRLDEDANKASGLSRKIRYAKDNLDQRTIAEYREAGLQGIIDRYETKKKNARKKLQNEMKKGAVTFSTFGTLLKDEIVQEVPFDVVIVDEATRMRSPELVLALLQAGTQIIFVGDPRQLGNIPLDPTMHKAMDAVIQRYSVAQLQQQYRGRISEEGYQQTDDVIRQYEDGPYTTGFNISAEPAAELPYVFLDTNRRSLPNIVNVLSELIYDGQLKPGRESSETLGDGIVQWMDTQHLESHEKTSGTSKKNAMEATIIVNKILHRVKNGTPPEDIGVIATYREQAELIKKKLKRKLRGSEEGLALYEQMEPHIDSVDSFQGDERKVIYISLTRSNEEGHIGFLEEQRRIGVAIGRAQEELYIVGDASTVVDKNDDEESQAFFGKLHDLVGEYGEHKALKKTRGRRKRRRR